MSNVYAISSAKSTEKSKQSEKKPVDSQVMENTDKNSNFTQIANEFLDAGFDSDTVYTYLLIVRRAANNEKGFFETIETTATKTGISDRQLKYCRKLLEFCNIISITKRYDSKNRNRQTSSLITLVHKKFWNLAHEWRNAYKFGSKDYKPKLSSEIKKTRKVKEKKLAVQQLHGGHALTARGGVQQLHTYQDPDLNKIPSEQDPCLKKNVCDHARETAEQLTHTSLENHGTEQPKAERQSKKPPNQELTDRKLAGIIRDYVSELTKQKYIDFAITGKVVEAVKKSFPDFTNQQFLDEFEAFKICRNLHDVFDKNTATVDSLQRAFLKWLNKKYPSIAIQEAEKPKVSSVKQREKVDWDSCL